MKHKLFNQIISLYSNHQDIILLIMLSFLCGWVSSALGLPTMFGYIMAGVILGSSGLNLIMVSDIDQNVNFNRF